MVTQKGHAVGNIDSVVIAERPRLASHIESMRASIAEVAGINIERGSVKATTDRLGTIGREEGIAALAVVLLE